GRILWRSCSVFYVKKRASDLAPTLATIAGGVATALAIATAIECHQYATSARPGVSWTPSLIYGAVVWFWWAGVALGLWKISLRRPAIWTVSLKNTVVQILIAAVIAGAHLYAMRMTVHQIVGYWPYLGEIGYDQAVTFSTQRMSLEGLLYVILWATCAAVRLQIARQQQALQLAELKQQLSSAHLRALQMQLKPHFLFNTLNAITALVELGRQDEAVSTLSHLNAILRSTLTQQVPEKVPVAQELAVIENYLAIEQIRFSDRLRVEMHVDSDALDGLMPCFLLQPIIENAIRHGISQLEGTGTVRTAIERANGQLRICVRDNGPGLRNKSSAKGHGVGLRSTADRLEHFYPGGYEFSSGELESGGFEVSIRIPYERALA
ncbi:MAG TPA: histidine kinase, partial [Steroidobacteraceae bacterium]|nr:histidine kinase [Steroidobacteraceae bacterium]